ncbi:MAG: hypothetical protein AUG08_07090 [Acidobacteria bacterium 13_1_20CM_2_55_15]|nr:MAG: hypothetical protein AUG08_07090 [Acidobacteria bacterium 13_1_20CM_2_55_15]
MLASGDVRNRYNERMLPAEPSRQMSWQEIGAGKDVIREIGQAHRSVIYFFQSPPALALIQST